MQGLSCDFSSSCKKDSDCSLCKTLGKPYKCTFLGRVQDFCLFCNTYTPFDTCPDGICACGPSFFNSENCYSGRCSDTWEPNMKKIMSCTLGTQETGLVKQEEKQEATELDFQRRNKLNNAEFVKIVQQLEKEL